jgi:hypothetical protein
VQVGIFCRHQNIGNYYLNDRTRELGLERLRRVISLPVRKQSLTLCYSCLVCSCCCREIILLRSKSVVVLTLLEIIKKKRFGVYISCQVQSVPRECKSQLMKKLPVHESELIIITTKLFMLDTISSQYTPYSLTHVCDSKSHLFSRGFKLQLNVCFIFHLKNILS